MIALVFTGILTLAGLVPLAVAWRANRTTSLSHAVLWAGAAWLAWGGTGDFEPDAEPGFRAGRYVALCLVGAAGVAVLGARRPYVGAWNFVVLGLLGVLLLPLAESLAIGTDPVDPLRVTFLSATLAVGLLNYLPTRFYPVALLLAVTCAGEVVFLFVPLADPGAAEFGPGRAVTLLAPWMGLYLGRSPRAGMSPFDQEWLAFRDRFGWLWGQRVRDHFNQAAKNAGWPVTLTWGGLREDGKVSPETEAAMRETLRAVLKRFM